MAEFKLEKKVVEGTVMLTIEEFNILNAFHRSYGNLGGGDDKKIKWFEDTGYTLWSKSEQMMKRLTYNLKLAGVDVEVNPYYHGDG